MELAEDDKEIRGSNRNPYIYTLNHFNFQNFLTLAKLTELPMIWLKMSAVFGEADDDDADMDAVALLPPLLVVGRLSPSGTAALLLALLLA